MELKVTSFRNIRYSENAMDKNWEVERFLYII